MRKIKIRAWHNEKRHWFTTWNNPGYSNTVYPDEFPAIYTLCSSNNMYTIEEWSCCLDDFGKEIFEGDIVSITIEQMGQGETFEQKTLGEVVLDNAAWGVRLDDDSIIYFHTLLRSDRISVIGNIHENPDLLEAK